ncbi:hypothetical protein [Streptomyces nigra]|uniref:hypothetical protein n=1 Tax=Streptomyces nigra TaxID=1827580 RepID=UPI0035D55871
MLEDLVRSPGERLSCLAAGVPPSQVGVIRLNEEVVRLTDAPGTRIIFSGADEGTESAERLRLLATLT